MKKMVLVFLCCLLAASLAPSVSAAEPVELMITCPSTANSIIAPGRDFYVLGNISGAIPERAQLSVSLIKAGQTAAIRKVSCNLKNDTEGIYTGYPGLAGNTDPGFVPGSLMPDLVYEPSNIDSFRDAWRKCSYDDSNFSALISGGRYRSELRQSDENGKLMQPLEQGDYDIVVTLRYRSRTLAKATKRITLANTPQKAIASLAPKYHAEMVKTDAYNKGIYLYTDPMPGCWPASCQDDLSENYAQITLPARKNQAIRAEYSTGLSYLYLYNIAPDSAANTLALGILQQQGVIGSGQRLRICYYDIGEPRLSCLPERVSHLVEFPENNSIVFTRAEITASASKENFYDPGAAFEGTIDFNLYNGVSAFPGSTLSLYGAAAPIQNSALEIVETSEHLVAASNRISTILYTLEGGGMKMQFDREVSLTRRFDGKDSLSIYEFKHNIPITEGMSGRRFLVTADAVNAYGQIIDDSRQMFSLSIEAAPAEHMPGRTDDQSPASPQEREVFNPPTGSAA